MLIPVFRGTVRKGKFQIDNQQQFEAFLRSLEGSQVEVLIRKPTKRRSPESNRYYHAVVVKLLAEHTGHSAGEIHEILKTRFLSDPETGTVGSTSKLSTMEFTEYIELCRQLAAEIGINIPDPHSVATKFDE